MLRQLFLSFLKIGAFTIGGAYAMIPLIKTEVCQKRHWLSEEEFLDGIAAAQSCPGPIAVNTSIYVGYHVQGRWGVVAAVLGTIIPSTVSIILIAMLFNKYTDQILVQKAFNALKPAVVALIAVPLIEMSKKSGMNLKNMWFPISVAVLVGVFTISPAYLILFTIAFAVWEARK